MPDNAVSAMGLEKSFRRLGRRPVKAVREVDLQVRPGQVVAIVGPNGAGKTTTLRMLLGFLRPDRGSAYILGSPAASVAAHRSLGFVGERFKSDPFLTPRRLLSWLGTLSGIDRSRLGFAVTRELERLDLTALADRRLGALSQGELQRLGLAQALVHRPAVLILDEPATGLDPEGRRRFAEIVQAERDRGAAILLSSHILGDVERVCDAVAILRAGEVVMEGSIEELTRDAGGRRRPLEEVYLEAQRRTG